MANQLLCIDFLTPPTPLIIPHRLITFLESLMPLKNWCSIHARWSKSNLKHSLRFCGIFPSIKQNFIAYRFPKVSSRPDCIFEIHQLSQSGFSRVYSNCYCSCSFVQIGQSSHKMYSNNIFNFQESKTILNACTKKYWKLIEYTTYVYIYTPTKTIRKTITSKFQTTLPHTHTHIKYPEDTHTPTHRGKITVSEIQNHSNARTHAQRQKHVKYQRGAKQTKVNTL